MNRAELVKTLELIKPALATVNIVPIFQCFIFDNDEISAYNDTIAIVGPNNESCEEPYAVHGNTLLGLLSNTKNEEVELVKKDDALVVRFGKTQSKLPIQPKENFIFEKPDDSLEWDFKIPFTQSIFEAIEMCLETVSTDATQEALKGITLDGSMVYSTDGDALTRVNVSSMKMKKRVFISTQFCSAVVKLWSTLSVTKGTLYFNDKWSCAEFGDWSVFGTMLEIKNPIDLEELIKSTVKDATTTLPVPEGFSEALSRARVLSDPESQKTVATITKGKLQLSTDTHMGHVKDEIVFKGHPDVVAHINAAHTQRALEFCDKMAFLENCTVFEKSPHVLQLVSNMD